MWVHQWLWAWFVIRYSDCSIGNTLHQTSLMGTYFFMFSILSTLLSLVNASFSSEEIVNYDFYDEYPWRPSPHEDADMKPRPMKRYCKNDSSCSSDYFVLFQWVLIFQTMSQWGLERDQDSSEKRLLKG